MTNGPKTIRKSVQGGTRTASPAEKGEIKKRVAGAFGRDKALAEEKKAAAAALKKQRSKKTVPPAVPSPLFDENGNVTVREAVLELVCGVTSKVPETALPEIAFAGKSNVGKSSLLNALVNRKALARTSARPGKTQTINFYRVNGMVYFVDLPGYGYANASERERAAWGEMIERYLNTSKQLKTVFLLVDIRHEPSGNDCMMYDWIASRGLRAVIIATKADKVKRSQIASLKKTIRGTLGCPKDTPVIPFSSETKDGREEVFSAIRSVIES